MRLWRLDGESSSSLGSGDPPKLDGDWHTLRLEVRGTRIRLLIDSQLVAQAVDARYSAGGRVGLVQL